MKLRDCYPLLQEPAVVKAVVIRSVHALVALKNQAASLANSRPCTRTPRRPIPGSHEQRLGTAERGVEGILAESVRNLIAHKHFRIDLARLWQISQDTISGLRLILENLFTDLNRQFASAARV